jgi:hypothetical protein
VIRRIGNDRDAGVVPAVGASAAAPPEVAASAAALAAADAVIGFLLGEDDDEVPPTGEWNGSLNGSGVKLVSWRGVPVEPAEGVEPAEVIASLVVDGVVAVVPTPLFAGAT